MLSFVSVFIFFTFAKSKLLSYILPVFPACALMIGAWVYRAHRALRAGVKPKRSLGILSVIFFGIIPVGLIVGCAAYGVVTRLNILRPVFLTGIFLIPFSWASLYFAFKRKFQRAFTCVIAAMTGSAIFIFGWLFPAADLSFASKEDVKTVEKLMKPGETPLLLADRLFVRGVCYYSGSQNVGVLTDNPDKMFYTKHDVRTISKLEDFLALDKNRFPIYGFLKPKGLRLLDKIIDYRFSYHTLRSGKNRVLIRLDRV